MRTTNGTVIFHLYQVVLFHSTVEPHVPRDRTIYIVLTEAHYKRDPNVTKLLEKNTKNFVKPEQITSFQNGLNFSIQKSVIFPTVIMLLNHVICT